MTKPIDLPDWTAVVVAPDDADRDDSPVPPDEIVRVLAAIQPLQRLDIPDAVAADLDAWERKVNQHGIDRSVSGIEDVFW